VVLDRRRESDPWPPGPLEVASVLRGRPTRLHAHLGHGDFVILSTHKIRNQLHRPFRKGYYRPPLRQARRLKTENLWPPFRPAARADCVEKAIKGMLPHNALGGSLFRKLKGLKELTIPTARPNSPDHDPRSFPPRPMSTLHKRRRLTGHRPPQKCCARVAGGSRHGSITINGRPGDNLLKTTTPLPGSGEAPLDTLGLASAYD